MEKIKITYFSDTSTLTLATSNKTTSLYLAELAQLYHLIQEGTLYSILEKDINELGINIPLFENKATTFLQLVDKTKQKIQKEKEEEKKQKSKPNKKMKADLWKKYFSEKESGPCYTCNISIFYCEGKGWHASHVIATSKGGFSELDNLRPCCKKCNLTMGNQNIYAYIEQNKLTGPGSSNVTAYFTTNPLQKGDVRCVVKDWQDKPSKKYLDRIEEKLISTLQPPKSMEYKVNLHLKNVKANTYINIFPNSKLFTYDGKKLNIYTTDKGEIMASFDASHIIYIYGVVSNKRLLVINDKGHLTVWKYTNNKQTFLSEQKTHSAQVMSNGLIISFTEDYKIYIWSKEYNLISTLIGHKDKIKCCSLLPKGELVSVSSDKQLIVWNISKGSIISTLSGHDRVIYTVHTTNNIIASSTFNTTKIWDIESKICRFTLKGKTLSLLDNNSIITYNEEQLILWDMNTGALISSINLLGKYSNMFVFGNKVITLAKDSDILKECDIVTGNSRTIYTDTIINVSLLNSTSICINTNEGIKLLNIS
jgi:hypothetical protein